MELLPPSVSVLAMVSPFGILSMCLLHDDMRTFWSEKVVTQSTRPDTDRLLESKTNKQGLMVFSFFVPANSCNPQCSVAVGGSDSILAPCPSEAVFEAEVCCFFWPDCWDAFSA